MKELCQRKESLFREWQEAAEAYSKAVAALTETIGKVQDSEYNKRKTKVEIARKLVKQLRTELDDHIAMHGC
jgi:hypothetical protein